MPIRNPMRVHCPECGSDDVRMSRGMKFLERCFDLIGFPTMRCLNCQHRWLQSLWRMRESMHARCPKCYRLELSEWEETYYRIPFRWQAMLSLGAKKVRCKPCRHNFVSFRSVRGVRKWVNSNPVGPTPKGA